MGRKKNSTLTDVLEKLERDYLTLRESLLRIQRDVLKIKTLSKPSSSNTSRLSKALTKFNPEPPKQKSLFDWEYLANVPHHHLAHKEA